MADESLDAQLQRLAAIVAPLAETVNQHDARMAHHEAMMTRMAEMLASHEARMAALERIAADLQRLIAHVFHARQDGREG
jgi:uncharacterized protein (DUF3084 family)